MAPCAAPEHCLCCTMHKVASPLRGRAPHMWNSVVLPQLVFGAPLKQCARAEHHTMLGGTDREHGYWCPDPAPDEHTGPRATTNMQRAHAQSNPNHIEPISQSRLQHGATACNGGLQPQREPPGGHRIVAVPSVGFSAFFGLLLAPFWCSCGPRIPKCPPDAPKCKPRYPKWHPGAPK